MTGIKCRSFHVYTYHLLLEALKAEAARAMCSIIASVCRVLLRDGFEVSVLLQPPVPSHPLPCFFVILSPDGYNLKMQYSIKDNAMAT
jgi:hypothetical protein